MKKNILVVLIISLAIMAGVLVMSANSLKAQQGFATDPEISKKLDDILSNQKTILQSMADLKQEIYTIKIRVTQAQ